MATFVWPQQSLTYFVELLRDEVSSNGVFDLSYYLGNKRVWVWNNEDVKEVHIWCDRKADHRSAKRLGSDLTFSDSDGENDAHLPKFRGKQKCTRYCSSWLYQNCLSALLPISEVYTWCRCLLNFPAWTKHHTQIPTTECEEALNYRCV